MLALCASFEYLCHGSTAIIIILILCSAGIVFRRQNLTSVDVRSDVCERQILTSKDDPLAERFKNTYNKRLIKRLKVKVSLTGV